MWQLSWHGNSSSIQIRCEKGPAQARASGVGAIKILVPEATGETHSNLEKIDACLNGD